MEVTVYLKQIGKKKNSVQPAVCHLAAPPQNVRQLIEEMVMSCVKAYNERMEASELLRCLSKNEIEDRAAAGKIGFDINYGEKKADTKQAVENALQSFEDGIYRIFLDDGELTDLDAAVHITEETKLTFVRLTMLAGRMW